MKLDAQTLTLCRKTNLSPPSGGCNDGAETGKNLLPKSAEFSFETCVAEGAFDGVLCAIFSYALPMWAQVIPLCPCPERAFHLVELMSRCQEFHGELASLIAWLWRHPGRHRYAQELSRCCEVLCSGQASAGGPLPKICGLILREEGYVQASHEVWHVFLSPTSLNTLAKVVQHLTYLYHLPKHGH